MQSCRSLLALVALAAVGADCRPLFSPADEAVALELEVEPRPLTVGDSARVTLTLRNGGREQVTLRRSATCLVSFHLADGGLQEQSLQGEHPCGADVGFVAVSARGSWSQTYRWLPRASQEDEEPLPPGWYRLVGHVHDEEMTLVSEPVTFRVVPR